MTIDTGRDRGRRSRSDFLRGVAWLAKEAGTAMNAEQLIAELDAAERSKLVAYAITANRALEQLITTLEAVTEAPVVNRTHHALAVFVQRIDGIPISRLSVAPAPAREELREKLEDASEQLKLLNLVLGEAS